MVERCNPEWEGGNVRVGGERQLAGFRVMAIAKVLGFRQPRQLTWQFVELGLLPSLG